MMMDILTTIEPISISKKSNIVRALSYKTIITTSATINNASTFISSMDITLNVTYSTFYDKQQDIIEIPSYINNTAMCFTIVILILGIIGNILVPFVIMRTKDMRNSTNVFLINLSIADLLVLVICTPTIIIELNTKPDIWTLGSNMCKIVPFVELTVAHASVLTILAISFERYYAICKPLKAGYVCTKTRAILICFLAWLIAAGFTSPIFWMANYIHVNELNDPICLIQVKTKWSVMFFIMISIVFFVMPLIVLIILYGIISRKLINNKKPMMRLRPTKMELSLKARNQVILMLGIVIASFFLCLLPFRLLTFWIIFSSEQDMNNMSIKVYYSLLYFCRIMLYLNSAINPILYNLMSTKFRNAFCTFLHNIWNIVYLKCPQYNSQRKHNTVTNNANTASSTNTTSSSVSRNHSSQPFNINPKECNSIVIN